MSATGSNHLLQFDPTASDSTKEERPSTVSNDPVKSKRTRRRRASVASSIISWPTLGVVLTTLTVVLTLLGYGADFGYLEQFQLTPEDLQRTPLDFLLRSYRAVFLLIDFSNSLKAKLNWALLFQWVHQIRLALVLVCGLAFVIAYALTLAGRRSIQRVTATVLASEPVGLIAGHLGRLTSWVVRNWAAGWLAGVVAALTAGSFVAALPFLFGAVVLFLASFFLVFVGLVPLLPTAAVGEIARKQVINPPECRKLVGNADPQIIAVRCVRVVRQGCELGRGRYIEQSSNRVWLLYEPPVQIPARPTLKVFSVPMDGNVIEEVDTEAPQPQPSACLPSSTEQRNGGTQKP